VFFDDIDAIAMQRGGMGGNVAQKGSDRLLNQLLVETDGLDSGSSADKVVIVMAASARPEAIDRALMRPGRLDQVCLVYGCGWR
jgi:ATP-dependent Zn protease